MSKSIEDIGRAARTAASELASQSEENKNRILEAMANGLNKNRNEILTANARDLDAAQASGLTSALRDRLLLDDKRLDGMIEEILSVQSLPDPVGRLLSETVLPSGLTLKKQAVPIGVIGIIYESRPNVTSDASALCIKAGNAVILRGGKEAIHSNTMITQALVAAGSAQGLPAGALQLIESSDRSLVQRLVQATDYLDLIIPRGGEGLIQAVTESAHVPVIKHYKGICHIYVDWNADIDTALAICENAKCQRPGVCNAMETLLVHSKIAPQLLPRLCKLLQKRGVEIRGDQRVLELVPEVVPSIEQDWSEEYLDLILSIKIVDGVFEAIHHINHYGSHHSDAILSDSPENQQLFVQQVDSAAVYVNASTRFTDGSQFGLGSEIGISTDKLHARGPMGLEELTTYKWIGIGQGTIRE